MPDINPIIEKLMELDSENIVFEAGQIPTKDQMEDKLDYFCGNWKYEKKDDCLFYVAKNKFMMLKTIRFFQKNKDQMDVEAYNPRMRDDACAELLLQVIALIYVNRPKPENE